MADTDGYCLEDLGNIFWTDGPEDALDFATPEEAVAAFLVARENGLRQTGRHEDAMRRLEETRTAGG